MTLLIVLGCLLAYPVVGVLYGRSQYLRLWKRCRANHLRKYPRLTEDRHWRFEVIEAVVLRVTFWPLTAIWDGIRRPVVAPAAEAFSTWFTRSVTAPRGHAVRLREEAETWRKLGRSSAATATERTMAARLAEFCDERAREVEP